MTSSETKVSQGHDNPSGPEGIEFIEFAAFDDQEAQALTRTLEGLGFRWTARHRSKGVWLFQQGGINLIVDLEPASAARSFATMHGVSVCATAFRVADSGSAHRSALRRGAKDHSGVRGPGELEIPAVRDLSGSLIYFVDHFGPEGTIYDIDFEAEPLAKKEAGESDLLCVDHISLSVQRGSTRKWVSYYSKLFGFYEVDHNCITDPEGYVLSTVLKGPGGNVRICIDEPIDENTNCDLFLKENFGEGIQHIAFETRDLMGFLQKVDPAKVELLPIPAGYYRDLEKEGYDRSLVEELRHANVMIDTEGGGRFLHAYSRPIENRFFFEIVQRNDHGGFGRHDATARLLALQGRDEVAAHVRERPPSVPRIGTTIDYQTILIGTVGVPGSRLQTPEIMGGWLARHGANAAWLPFLVDQWELARFVDGARSLDNLTGFTVSAPLKTDILPLLDEVTERARWVAAVNAVRRQPDGRLLGDIFDGSGFLRGVEAAGVTLVDASAWIVGAGSVGRAIALSLAEAGVRHLAIQDFDEALVRKLTADLEGLFPRLSVSAGEPDPSQIDLAVNATPVGKGSDDPIPFDPSTLRDGATVAETVIFPKKTRLLRDAENHGCVICTGMEMLENQLGFFVDFMDLDA
jgi:4-hydroxyphenylpyruvate dioxygenase